jgi:oligopeptide transport system substrate-binding protein
MYLSHGRTQRFLSGVMCLCTLSILLVACGGGSSPTTSAGKLAAKQVLTFPIVGTADIDTLDPAAGPATNGYVAVMMMYSGLVRAAKNLSVLPDQATSWDISADNKVYTFHLRHDITFSDGTPVTAQTYVYTWTRALLPAVNSPIATFFEGNIVGASDVNSGKTKTLAGVRALDDYTLQVTLTQPTPYFLEELINPLFFPLNQKVIDKYGQKKWMLQAAGNPVGTGPFMLKSWTHNVRVVLVPNPHYYGPKTKLTEVDMPLVSDPSTAYKSYRAGQYDFIWDMTPEDQQTAESTRGFIRNPLLQTDLLFFLTTKPPFDNVAVRQAFAYATDKSTLAQAIFKGAVTPAPTIIPPGMPGYQPDYPGLQHDAARAKQLFQSVYPNAASAPTITFTYPTSQVPTQEAAALQQMWQNALGIQVKLQGMELSSYVNLLIKHQIQLGFMSWTADFPDPYDWMTLILHSGSASNNGNWSNPTFDQLVTKADTLKGDARIALYNQAEQIAITQVALLPLDHGTMTAIIPSWVHGVTLNGQGLYFGNWSDVYLLQH